MDAAANESPNQSVIGFNRGSLEAEWWRIMKSIEVSGLVRSESGIGVIQRNVYPLLRHHFEIVEAPTRDTGGRVGTLKGIGRGLRSGQSGHDGHFCVVSPLPLKFSYPLVTLVHDLRWVREASSIKRIYRKMDLARVVKNSNTIICVSDTTRNDLIQVFPEAEEKSTSAWLGPGIVGDDDVWEDGIPGRLLLVGGAKRKRNELAASVIGYLPTGTVDSVVGVGVSEETKAICERVLSPERCVWLAGISDQQLIREFCDAQFYAHFGMNEGFGLPFVESLRTGTTVIAIDQDLTREILGDSAILVSGGNAEAIADSWASATLPSADARSKRGQMFSWDNLAGKVIQALNGDGFGSR